MYLAEWAGTGKRAKQKDRMTWAHEQRPYRRCFQRTGGPVGHKSVSSTGLYGRKVPVSYPPTPNLLKARIGGPFTIASPEPKSSQMFNKYMLNERANA